MDNRRNFMTSHMIKSAVRIFYQTIRKINRVSVNQKQGDSRIVKYKYVFY